MFLLLTLNMWLPTGSIEKTGTIKEILNIFLSRFFSYYLQNSSQHNLLACYSQWALGFNIIEQNNPSTIKSVVTVSETCNAYKSLFGINIAVFLKVFVTKEIYLFHFETRKCHGTRPREYLEVFARYATWRFMCHMPG